MLIWAFWSPRAASAYSVLAHEALIDAVWGDQLTPLLRARFPRSGANELRAARAYAYGGSLIQDLGYYPFGSRFFSNLVHYVRSGDFVRSLVRESRDIDEYAFALGALAHFASDTVGHPVAVNRAVPLIYPKLRKKYGPVVLYAHSPSRHIMVEFAFDVLQAARGNFKSDVYQELIGFQVARGVLERAFRATYALELTDVFGDTDLAIGTYRHAASQIIPDVTRIAWREKRDEILAANPKLTEQDFVFRMTRSEYEKTFGTTYRKPRLLSRIVVAIFKVLPKFGPFKPLAFEPLTPEAERMFVDSFARSTTRYRQLLQRTRAGELVLSDTDLDTGAEPELGVNPLADETYEDLIAALAKDSSSKVSSELRRAINHHYGCGIVDIHSTSMYKTPTHGARKGSRRCICDPVGAGDPRRGRQLRLRDHQACRGALGRKAAVDRRHALSSAAPAGAARAGRGEVDQLR
jgi:hypothetical protein